MSNDNSVRSRLPYAIRILHARPRLMASAALGIALILLLPAGIPLSRRLLAGWNVGVVLYLLLLYRGFAAARRATSAGTPPPRTRAAS